MVGNVSNAKVVPSVDPLIMMTNYCESLKYIDFMYQNYFLGFATIAIEDSIASALLLHSKSLQRTSGPVFCAKTNSATKPATPSDDGFFSIFILIFVTTGPFTFQKALISLSRHVSVKS